MPTPLSPEAFNSIQAQALLHVLKGGGVLPDDGSTDIEDAIGSVATEFFRANAAIDKFNQALAGLDTQTCDQISSAMWHVVAQHEYAAFTFGAAVATQLRGRPAPRRPRSRVKKGSRS